MDVTIRRSSADDIGDVIRFIDQYWEPGHALATCRPLLDWQHKDPDGRGYSFVLARRRGDDAVLGILGFIATTRFDATLVDDNVIWLTTWKVREDAEVAGLGLALLQFLTRSEPHVAIGALGLNPATVPIYRALGYRVGELRHYVYVNAAVAAFEIATLAPRKTPPAAAPGAPLEMRRLTHEELGAPDWTPGPSHIPRKTLEYFRTRYARHPVYAYVIVGLFDRGRPAAIIAARTAEHSGRRALRIVDFLGSEGVLARSGPVVQALLDELDAEYADVYNTGLDGAVFERAGFEPVDPDGPQIVPDHFEPFERRNVRLWYSLKGSQIPVLFKGDADQDRPNRVTRSVP
jgi:hypothetical protein